ncbi:MAG: fimbrillin family protein [Bacteroidales bacterium]|nr:fimbrillin family protein [Bacteroidales bacterium]
MKRQKRHQLQPQKHIGFENRITVDICLLWDCSTEIVLFFAAILGGVLAGCSKNEIESSNPQLIAFNTPVVGNATKAAIVTNEYPTSIPFDVWALFTDNKLNGDLDATGVNQYEYFKKIEFSYNGNSEHPSYVNSGAFWPKQNGYLTFKALSPAGVTNAENSWVKSTAGISIPYYTVNQDDLMYSDFAYDQTKSNETDKASDSDPFHYYEGNDILFKHALSAIRFKVKLEAADVSSTVYQITSIKLFNHRTVGAFNEYASPQWSGQTAPIAKDQSVTLELHNTGVNVPVNASPLALYDGSTGVYIVLPQDLEYGDPATDVSVTIDYTEKIGGLTAQSVQADNVKLHNLSSVTTWDPGKIYTYTIIIGRDQIRLDPAVETWETNNVDVDGPKI